MGAEPVDFSPPPPPEPTLSPEPEISGKDRGGNWKADMMSALGESVSFGRFLSEPLEWGKRSAFAHNRYLEEAAVQARPGSVAQKKAFFEAHYARKKRKSEDHAAAASDDVAGGDGELEAAEDGGAASWSLSATESSCMTDEPPAPAEEVCCGWEEDRVVDCGGSASDKPVHVPEELADITDAVGPCCRMDAPTDETQHMEGGDEVVGAVLPLQKQDLCMDSLTAVDATLKEISILNQDITDSVKRRRIQMASLLPKPAKLSSPPTAKKGQNSSAKRRSMRHSAKENNSPPSAGSNKLRTTSTPKKRSTLSALHMSMSFPRCESGNTSMASRNLGTTIAARISELEHANATKPAEKNTKPHDLRLPRKKFSSALPEIAPRTSQVDEERSSHIMKIKEKLFGSTFPTLHQKYGITKEKEATQEILSSSKSGHLSRDINQAHQTGKDAQTSKDASDAKQICCFPLRKMY
ncbi:uncharacterized protein [Zea mays]|uniref:TPX2 (Targeting protein for Xklp2) protein family n=1 Tax=Zea mays TaxID=4577 RepID=K7TMY7_MAIZE|nr:uncharacterized protein LOC100278361 isoform X1 [Zea mays]AQK39676.1 TPX2 (targeting protein for Xklp2) protein family [Zea mays]|eukprot:XP_008661782.1 uncharacterized protein LOC100278361 isoform X1 [Zea mays]